MQIQVLSDVHREVESTCAQDDVVDLGADLVILAGDIDQGGAGVRWATETWPATPVVYVLGNHEPYGSSIDGTLARCRAAAAGTNVHVLERETVKIAGVRILGATLWTDLELAGDAAFARSALGQGFPDYNAIESPAGGRLRPAETEAIHHETVAWLARELNTPYAGPTIVVTHHAPSSASLQQWDEWAGETPWTAWEAAFASHLEWLLTGYGPPALWIHGHTHTSCDYRIGGTRVISNQRGYEQETSGWEPDCVLELRERPPLAQRLAQMPDAGDDADFGRVSDGPLEAPAELPFLRAITWQGDPDVHARFDEQQRLHKYEREWRWRGVLAEPSDAELDYIRRLAERYGSWLADHI